VKVLFWVVLVAMVSFMLYSRFAGKTSSTDARALVAAGGALVDVRTPAEFAAGHVDGAVNIPVDQIERRAGEIGPSDRPVVVYCASGMRSASAASTLRRLGFTTVADVGGMSSY